MTYETLLLQIEERIATITINRPTKLNALNKQVKRELTNVLNTLAQDDQVAILLITGAGEKSFIAGDDIAEFNDRTKDDFKPFQEITLQIENLRKPVIAVINGYALGGGTELALACDFRIASTNAKFGLPEITLGIIPGAGGTQRLPKVIGKSKALELIMTGEMIDASTALALGLIDKLVLPAELMPSAISFAKKLLQQSRLAIECAKEAVNYSTTHSVEVGLEKELELLWKLKNTPESKQKVEAFLKKNRK
jgi:enoyl-CoA hydratase